MRTFLQFCKYVFLGIVGGAIYAGVEILFRGHTDISMVIVGGLCFIMCGIINEVLSWDTALVSQMMMGSLVITVIEFVAGCVLNLWLGLGIWDYSQLPYNLMGQICLIFSIGWFFLSLPGILLDDWIRYKFFGEEKPRYKIL